MRGERIASCWMHWEKYIELTFDSKGELFCIKDKDDISMPMPMPMPMSKCRCRVFQVAIIVTIFKGIVIVEKVSQFLKLGHFF